MLVNHEDRYKINYIQRTTVERQNQSDIDGLYKLQWEDGNEFNFEGGELKGYVDMRDGNGDATAGSMNRYKGVPYYTERLNQFARIFARSINEGSGANSGFEDGFWLGWFNWIKLICC